MNGAAQKLKTAAPTQQAIVLAYRQLYRQGLKVLNYSTPARHVLRRILRTSFRSASRDEFDPNRVANTLQFLQRAADSRGLEHKIVKNLIMVRYWEQPQVKKDARVFKNQDVNDIFLRRSSNAHFNSTLMLLNESLGTCLR
ncbi:hypothetical protein DTO166G4_589 [Paecilomyces variotii]|uniref:Uncharacterized protein n=1 Tax=Byssochlamys spectabilis TaxID=264951 RepID=A0A443HL18_BYSSP|nr:hypothetical protein C8Q69DRAFT_510135 [Paecilomyces variotii]KAJ9193562.1 hypothetical protein DTO164E3_7818 [Paecilomyces variotii]KAJ9195383.1 hypothetical protein DTO032I3_6876 [Paecilomyces variotii]KAJ9217785.1 hypothetical protein DTO166G4_589 [Paecilomyces variotii]KAJ9219351.1 hypothetical protein DTO169C6_8323 [Paecilomyces variotii]KAJ9230860.1 hypothetical protein DTO166G5_7099 [Paecilomyces variotii]